MPSSRRRFLKGSALGLAGLAASPAGATGREQDPTEPPPGMPPAFGTGPAGGPEITPATIAEAEKLAQVEYTPAERAQAAASWRVSMAPLRERRTGPRKVALEATLAPASRWDPVLPGVAPGPSRSTSCAATAPRRRCRAATRTSPSRGCPPSRAGSSRAR